MIITSEIKYYNYVKSEITGFCLNFKVSQVTIGTNHKPIYQLYKNIIMKILKCVTLTAVVADKSQEF